MERAENSQSPQPRTQAQDILRPSDGPPPPPNSPNIPTSASRNSSWVITSSGGAAFIYDDETEQEELVEGEVSSTAASAALQATSVEWSSTSTLQFSKFRNIAEKPPDRPYLLKFQLVKKDSSLAQDQEREKKHELNRLKAFKREGEDMLVSRFLTLLSRPMVDVDELRREAAENWVPDSLRDVVWKLLCGYMPAKTAIRDAQLRRTREAYVHMRDHLYAKVPTPQSPDPEGDLALLAQIRVDIPRTNPIEGVSYFRHVNFLWKQSGLQLATEHLSFVWAKQHSVNGYFQGLSDLLVPFLVVFSYNLVPDANEPVATNSKDTTTLSQIDWDLLEADTYWCFCRLFRFVPHATDGSPASAPPPSPALPAPKGQPARSWSSGLLQAGLRAFSASADWLLQGDEEPIPRTNSGLALALREQNKRDWEDMHSLLHISSISGIPGIEAAAGHLPIASQAGIQAMVELLRDVVAFHDPVLYLLYAHLSSEGVDFMFFSMRWVVCMLTREMPLCALLCLWDQYFASDNLYRTHIYVCAALLETFRAQLLELQFGEMLMLLQSLPSQLWDAEEGQLFEPSYHLKKVFKLAGIIYQDHVRSRHLSRVARLALAIDLVVLRRLSELAVALALEHIVLLAEATAQRAPIQVLEEAELTGDPEGPI